MKSRWFLTGLMGVAASSLGLMEEMRIPDNVGLWQAANRGDGTKVRSLLNQNNINVNTKGPGGDEVADSPLMAAARGGYTDIVRTLLDNGADPRRKLVKWVHDPETNTEKEVTYDAFYFAQPYADIVYMLENQPLK